MNWPYFAVFVLCCLLGYSTGLNLVLGQVTKALLKKHFEEV